MQRAKNRKFSNCLLEMGTVCVLKSFYRGTNGCFIALFWVQKGEQSYADYHQKHSACKTATDLQVHSMSVVGGQQEADPSSVSLRKALYRSNGI